MSSRNSRSDKQKYYSLKQKKVYSKKGLTFRSAIFEFPQKPSTSDARLRPSDGGN